MNTIMNIIVNIIMNMIMPGNNKIMSQLVSVLPCFTAVTNGVCQIQSIIIRLTQFYFCPNNEATMYECLMLKMTNFDLKKTKQAVE